MACVLVDAGEQANERSLRELADSMPQIVWAADAAGVIDYHNRRWYEYTGEDAGEPVKASWAEVVHPDDRIASVAQWDAAVSAGAAYEIEHRLRDELGNYRWFLRRALPIRDSAGNVTRWYGTCTDIDARKHSEDELRVAAELLRHSNRELEDFATIASHDLQEPLRKIQSFVDLVEHEPEVVHAASTRAYLVRIRETAARMRGLIDDLLVVSQVSSKGGPFEAVALDEVLAGVLLDLDVRIAETGGRVDVTPLPVVASDALQMRLLLQNLIGNALKFQRADVAPIVRITAQLAGAADGEPVPDGCCRLDVADNGIGFDEKYLDRVFTIFQRLHGRGVYPGTGIGLAICRKIAERHGGTITARSTPGQGATFSVTLPLAPAEELAHGG